MDDEIEGVVVDGAEHRIAVSNGAVALEAAMAAFEASEIENRIEGPFYSPAIATGLGRGHRSVNKGYRDSYDRLLAPEEPSLADRTFGREIGLYLGGTK